MVKAIDELMQKEMTRSEFLAALGLGLISLLGFDRVLHLFNAKGGAANRSSSELSYGSSTYGGSKETTAKKVVG